MTTRSDILDGKDLYRADGSIKDRGLVYTNQCGWIDIGHANPKGKGHVGATSLWMQIKSQTTVGDISKNKEEVTIFYEQSMSKFGMKSGVTKKYAVKKVLESADEQKSIALAIFLDVSIAFESLQANWFFRHVTNSGYSAEDLVSNLIGFYRAVHPMVNYIEMCEPVSKEQAIATWDTYGAVGSRKNYDTNPVIFPNPMNQCGFPHTGTLPPALSTMRPAVMGKNFRLL